MSRVSIYNFIFGFSAIFFAAVFGAFLAFDATDTLTRAPLEMLRWENTLARSAHGHTNLFGLLHIAFGLTFPFSVFSNKSKVLQSIFLGCGTFAMGPLMILRSRLGLPIGTDFLGGIIGLCLSLALVAILMQIIGLSLKTLRHSL